MKIASEVIDILTSHLEDEDIGTIIRELTFLDPNDEGSSGLEDPKMSTIFELARCYSLLSEAVYGGD